MTMHKKQINISYGIKNIWRIWGLDAGSGMSV